jgi:hypothetical protein
MLMRKIVLRYRNSRNGLRDITDGSMSTRAGGEVISSESILANGTHPARCSEGYGFRELCGCRSKDKRLVSADDLASWSADLARTSNATCLWTRSLQASIIRMQRFIL